MFITWIQIRITGRADPGSGLQGGRIQDPDLDSHQNEIFFIQFRIYL